jgi:tRNA-binding protein
LNSLFKSFKDLDIRVGTIINVERFEEAIKPSYKLKIDFGKLGVLKSSAQITNNYTPEHLLGFQVIAVVNFPKKQIANFMSECLVLGVVDDDSVLLLKPDSKTDNGLRIA